MRNRTAEPHQKMLSEIRDFITTMHDHLLLHHRPGLVGAGMESCNNFEHVVETSLQQCILQPLSHFVYLRIEEYFTHNGYLFQVQRSIYQGRNRLPEEMGIRVSLLRATLSQSSRSVSVEYGCLSAYNVHVHVFTCRLA